MRLAEVPEPAPAADQILVQVRAISLNRGEVRAIARSADGEVPGWDVAGTVLEPAQLVGKAHRDVEKAAVDGADLDADLGFGPAALRTLPGRFVQCCRRGAGSAC